ncbi:hypothetical protein EV1_042291 [Malus domestica]
MATSLDCLSKQVKSCFLGLGAFPEDKKIPLDVLTLKYMASTKKKRLLFLSSFRTKISSPGERCKRWRHI